MDLPTMLVLGQEDPQTTVGQNLNSNFLVYMIY